MSIKTSTNIAKERQVGGNHYQDYAIQPVEFIIKNNIPFSEGCIIKYAMRWKDKDGHKDLDKIIHYAELLKEMYPENK